VNIALSVVLAVQGGHQKLEGVLAELDRQIGSATDVEVIVAYDAAEEKHLVATTYPWLVMCRGSDGALIPHLWRDGIDRARGERIALTIVHCRPAPGWLNRLRSADLTSFAAVGGGFENAPDADAMGWAIHLLRYLGHTPPFEGRVTLDVAGDNAVYDKKELQRHQAAFREGFWEPEVHALMGKAGAQLKVDPELVSIHDNGYPLLGFALQRYRHGTRFGRDRARAMSRPRRLAQLCASPLVPLVFGSKIARRAISRGDVRPHLLPALPYLLIFLHAWALGELRGTAQAVVGDP
jgi:hypothetical protein